MVVLPEELFLAPETHTQLEALPPKLFVLLFTVQYKSCLVNLMMMTWQRANNITINAQYTKNWNPRQDEVWITHIGTIYQFRAGSHFEKKNVPK